MEDINIDKRKYIRWGIGFGGNQKRKGYPFINIKKIDIVFFHLK